MVDAQNRLQRLEDLEAIRNLIASYGPLADSGDADGVAALWSVSGTYDVGGFGVSVGRPAIAALISGDTHQSLMAQGCAHILSPHQIMLNGATAIATGYSIVFRKIGDAYEAWRVSHNRWELSRQTDGNWLVDMRVNRPVSGAPLKHLG
ncbi:MAG: nuclear transport factor 2 family protein [Sphingorhabdus sp.]